MQKRKFDELISHFNRKVSDMGIDQKYKMELLGMISAIGFAHEKELSTNLAEVGTDAISRQQAIDIAKDLTITVEGYEMHNQAVMNYCADIMQLPPIQPVIVPCDYAKACNEVTMDKLTSAVAYYDVLEELRKHGYVLVDMREVTE